MTIKEAFQKVLDEDQPPYILKEWSNPENRKDISEFIHALLEDNEGKMTVKDLGFLCVVCLQAGKYLAEAG